MNIFQNVLSKTKALFSTSSGAIDLLFNPNSFSKEYSWSTGLAMSYYKSLGILNKAIDKRAEKVGEISFYLKKNDEVIREHELLDILAKPNPTQTGEQFMNMWQTYMDVYGKAFIYVAKEKSSFLMKDRKIELYHLNPKNCDAKFDNFGNFESVIFGGKEYLRGEVIYDCKQDPDDYKQSLSIFQSFVNAIGTGIDLEKLLAKTIKSGGKMEGIISFKNPNLNEMQMSKFKQALKEQMETSEGFGNLGFLGGDASFQKTNLTIAELGYNDLENRIIEKVCIATGVPRVLLGSFDDIKFDNAEASIKIFLRETIKPLMRQRCSKLNEKLELIPEEYELSFDDPSPEDVDLKLKMNENGSKNYYLTPNEMRANVGYDEIEGGDDILVPFTMSGNSNTEEVEDKLKKKEFNHPLKNYEFRRKYFEKRIIIQDRQENRFEKELKRYLKKQKNDLIEDLGGKKRIKSVLDSSFIISRETKRGIGIFFPLLMEYMIDAGMEASSLAGGNGTFNWTATISSSLDKRCNFFLDSINETTFKKLKGEFDESYDLGENRQDLIKRIENTYEQISEGRAKTIARTEVHNAVNDATLEGYKQNGMPIKIWVAVLDDRTRDEHAMMDGEERPIDMPFSNGLQYPDEINCRCQI